MGHKIFDSANEKRFDCSFSKFWGAEFLQTLKMNLTKKSKKSEKSKKELKKSKKWVLSQKKVKI